MFTVSNENPSEYRLEKMTDMDLGQMYLVNNKALIARSSSRILFFKIIDDWVICQEPFGLSLFTTNSRGMSGPLSLVDHSIF